MMLARFTSSRLVAGAALVAGVIMATSMAQASLVTYDGFDYTVGANLTGQNGGDGWAGAWAFQGAIAESSLSYTDANGNSLITSGASVSLASVNPTTDPPSNGSHTRSRRTMDQMLGADGSQVWLSYLSNPNNGEGGSVYLRMADGDLSQSSGAAVFDVVPHEGGNWGLRVTQRDGNPSNTSSVPVDGTAFLLVMIDNADPNDSESRTNIYLWVNPLLDEAPSIANADASLTNLAASYAFDRFEFFQSRLNYTPQVFDELRIGTTFEAVTPYIPEPASLGLVGLGAMVLLSARRRH